MAVRPHLRKCFEAIQSVQFADDLTILSMTSPEKEVVPFVVPVDPKHKNIEVWMVEITTAMRLGVRQQMLLGVQSYPTMKRTEWMQKWPGQVVLNGSQVHWTAETEAALDEKGNQGLVEYAEQLR